METGHCQGRGQGSESIRKTQGTCRDENNKAKLGRKPGEKDWYQGCCRNQVDLVQTPAEKAFKAWENEKKGTLKRKKPSPLAVTRERKRKGVGLPRQGESGAKKWWTQSVKNQESGGCGKTEAKKKTKKVRYRNEATQNHRKQWAIG